MIRIILMAAMATIVLLLAAPRPAVAHYTKGRLHEHVPHLNCLVLKYEHRHNPEVKALRAFLKAQGYRLYFVGHCWLKPGHTYRKNPCA